jgi:hypothetical protein
MADRTRSVVIGVSAGVAAAALAAACVFLAIWLYRRRASVAARTRSTESATTTLRDGPASLASSVSVSVVSDRVADWGQPPPQKRAAFWAWRGGGHNAREPTPLSVSGIPKYHYKYAGYTYSLIIVLTHLSCSTLCWDTENFPQSLGELDCSMLNYSEILYDSKWIRSCTDCCGHL